MINYSGLIKPIITEKAFDNANKGWYTFAVNKNLTKTKAKKLVEELFGVRVQKIKSAILKGEIKRSLRTKRKVGKPGFKKITVKLAGDQKIDIFETGK